MSALLGTGRQLEQDAGNHALELPGSGTRGEEILLPGAGVKAMPTERAV
jgi:hypothetical protein